MLNLALVGVGRWGLNYINTIEEIKNCKLVYVCSPSVDSKKISKKYIKIKNYKSLLSKKIDGIIIASPPSTHFRIASEFVKRNFNILLEKPIVLSDKEASQLKKIVSKSRSKIVPGHIFNFNEGIHYVNKFISRIGNVSSIECKNFSNGPVRTDVSDLWDRTYHDIYICLNLLKLSPKSVSCKYFKKYKITKVVLNYNNDIKVNIDVSSYSKTKIRNIKLTGKKGTIIFDDISKDVMLLDVKKTLIKRIKYNDNPLKKEIIEFLKIIGGQRKNFLQEAFETVKVLSFADISLSKKGKKIFI